MARFRGRAASPHAFSLAFTAEMPEPTSPSILAGATGPQSRRSSIQELRAIAQTEAEPASYRPARFFSIYVTRALLGTRVTPNTVTFAHLLVLIGAALLFSVGQREYTLAAGGLVFLSYIADCVDGELARLTGRTSKLGAQLEQMVHWVTNGVLLFAIGAGVYQSSGDVWVWPVACVAIIGDGTFHFLYAQLHMAADRNVDYGLLHVVTRALYLVMPIGTNLMILGAIFDRMLFAVAAWAVISNLAWIIVFKLYYQVEARRLREEWRERGAG